VKLATGGARGAIGAAMKLSNVSMIGLLVVALEE